MPGRRRRTAVALAVVAAVVATVTAASVGTHGGGRVDVPFVVATTAFGTALALVGLLLVGVRPGNRLGPVLAVTGGLVLAQTALREYAFTALTAAPGHPLAGAPLAGTAFWAGTWLDALWFPGGLTLALLLFPHGSPPSRRWRAVAVAAPVLAGVAAIGTAFAPGPLSVDSYDLDVAWSGPGGVTLGSSPGGLGGPFVVAGIAMLLAAAASLIARWRSAGGAQRQQIKPLALVAAVVLVSLPLQALPVLRAPMVALFVLAVVVGLPAALAVGALRYRLWQIDPVLVSVLVYGGLVAAATVAYGVAVVVVGGVLSGAQDRDAAAGLLPSVLATAAVAVLFGRVREWLTARARRLVLGVRATPYEALATMPRRLSGGAEGGAQGAAALAEAASALRLGLGVPAARVRARLAAGDGLTAWSVRPGSPADGPADDPADGPGRDDGDGGLVVVEARHLGEAVGDVAVRPSADRPLSRADRRLLDDLAAQAAPALRALALTFELRGRLTQIEAQADELRASRRRLAGAQFEERRRLERDLHDGAQQQLVTATVQLGAVQALLATAPDGGPARAAADRCRAALDACLDDLRELARGVLPPVLAARGLVAALRSRARTASVEVRVRAPEAVAAARFDPVVEGAVYFTCLEALQNVVKHAPGASAVVDLDVDGPDLVFDVGDDGPGLPVDPADGSGTGLLGMRDRIAAVGGELRVESTPGAGVSVHGTVPVRAPAPAPAPPDPTTEGRP